MKRIVFMQFISAVYDLLPHNVNLIKSWNSDADIRYDFDEDLDLLQINTRLLEPFKNVVPNSSLFKNHTIGDCQIVQVSYDQVKIDYTPEVISYQGNYDISVTLSHVLISVDEVVKNPIQALTESKLAFPRDIRGYPEYPCDIDLVSKATLDKLHQISRSMQSKRTAYFQSLITGVGNKRSIARDVQTKIKDLYEFINIFEQSLMELNSSDSVLLTPPVDVSDNFFSIPWYILDVNQSIKTDHIYYQIPKSGLNRNKEYVLGWEINIEIDK